MDVLAVAAFYLYIILLAAFDIGAFVYTYRITRVVGIFRGWVIFLVFVILFSAEGVIVFGASAALTIFNPSLLDSYLSNPSNSSSAGTAVYTLILAALLFAAMFELHSTFKRVAKPKEASG